jgi:hypothetical protein
MKIYASANTERASAGMASETTEVVNDRAPGSRLPKARAGSNEEENGSLGELAESFFKTSIKKY